MPASNPTTIDVPPDRHRFEARYFCPQLSVGNTPVWTGFGLACYSREPMKQVALGFRVHTGWAALVAVEAPVRLDNPTIVDRKRVEMIEGGSPEAPAFVYHAASKLPLKSAERLVQECTALAQSRAKDSLTAVVGELRDRGYEVFASGVIGAKRPLASSLETILGTHSLIHAAEGELFRGAIISANEVLKVPVTSVPAAELYDRAATTLGSSADEIRRRLTEGRRSVGKPWAQDQKESLLVALLAAATDVRPPVRRR